MSARARQAPGFTLIELLAVVAILAILIMILVPSLTKARRIAQRAICAGNFKQIGRLTYMFANTHGGRGPGNCGGYRNGDPAQEWRGRGFATYLNVEVLGMRHYWQRTAGFIQWMGYTPTKGWLYCPSVKYWGNPWPRAAQLNRNVSGGANWGTMPRWGIYGIKVDPPPSNPLPDDFVPYWEFYGLGPRLEQFYDCSYVFMLTEGEVASDDYTGIWPYDPIVLNDDPRIPAWAGVGGWYAFRHVLPNDERLYQEQATANFLYIDGHVNTMTANNRINCIDRFAFEKP